MNIAIVHYVENEKLRLKAVTIDNLMDTIEIEKNYSLKQDTIDFCDGRYRYQNIIA